MTTLPPSNKVIGIDLGTTFSCLACWKDDKVEVIPTASGRTMPSWVSFTNQGKLVGAAAKALASSNATNTVYDVKRILGRDYHDEVVVEESKAFPFTLKEGKYGEVKIQVEWKGAEKLLNPEEVSAMVLSEMRLKACEYLGEDVKDAVITVPAHFSNQQR